MNTITRGDMGKRKSGKQGRKAMPVASVTVAANPWDHGAMGRANRIGLVVEDAPTIDPDTGEAKNPNGVKRARRVDMLEVWHRRGNISTAGFNAAEFLRDAFEATQRAPGMPQSERVQSSPKPDHAVGIQIDRVSRFAAAMAFVAAEDRAMVDACVLTGIHPQTAFPRYRRDAAGGVAELARVLDRVAKAMGRG